MRSWSGIRFLVCALFALCAAGGFGASVMRQSSLPASGFADTEAVTNVVFSFAEDVARDFSVRLELDATPSNCVEVAFGCDADGDGRLGTAEAELFPELASTRPGWLFNRRWNLARLAVRGVDPAHERALAVLCGAGTAVYLR